MDPRPSVVSFSDNTRKITKNYRVVACAIAEHNSRKVVFSGKKPGQILGQFFQDFYGGRDQLPNVDILNRISTDTIQSQETELATLAKLRNEGRSKEDIQEQIYRIMLADIQLVSKLPQTNFPRLAETS